MVCFHIHNSNNTLFWKLKFFFHKRKYVLKINIQTSNKRSHDAALDDSAGFQAEALRHSYSNYKKPYIKIFSL